MTNTHVGRKDVVNYLHTGSRGLHNHRIPQAGTWHALNFSHRCGRHKCYKSLCGKVVIDNGGENEFGERVSPNVVTEGNVTCKQCLQRIKH